MRMDIESLENLSREGLLRSRRHPEADLTIWNYTERCQHMRLWSPVTLMCRGLIVDGEGRIVARPFAKFFNLGDGPKPPREPYVVQTKVDGSLGIVYELDGELRVASRGSFDSEQAVEGTRLLRERSLAVRPGTTPLFEVIYPENRIVVDYGDRRELILLACIDCETGRDAPLPEWDGPVVDHHPPLPVARLRQREGGAHFEGFVLVYESGHRVKLKLDEYVRLHRVMTGLTPHRVWESLRRGDDLDALLDGVPDETFEEVDAIREDIAGRHARLVADAHRVHEAAPLVPRKELAAYFFASDADPNLCFSLLDGRDISDQAWRLVEPKRQKEGDGVSDFS